MDIAGLIRIQTPLENAINASQCCQLALLPHSEMGIHARFRVSLPLPSTITTSICQIDLPTTSKPKIRQEQREGVCFTPSPNKVYFFHIDHWLIPFFVVTDTIWTPRTPRGITPPPLKTSKVLVFEGMYFFFIT